MRSHVTEHDDLRRSVQRKRAVTHEEDRGEQQQRRHDDREQEEPCFAALKPSVSSSRPVARSRQRSSDGEPHSRPWQLKPSAQRSAALRCVDEHTMSTPARATAPSPPLLRARTPAAVLVATPTQERTRAFAAGHSLESRAPHHGSSCALCACDAANNSRARTVIVDSVALSRSRSRIESCRLSSDVSDGG